MGISPIGIVHVNGAKPLSVKEDARLFQETPLAEYSPSAASRLLPHIRSTHYFQKSIPSTFDTLKNLNGNKPKEWSLSLVKMTATPGLATKRPIEPNAHNILVLEILALLPSAVATPHHLDLE
ncbi:9462_t:CDS:2 [Acaulospora colombiana]|uniref:9462_t:CDS:1 n=1 Tax=Acaulospora colombiana TaxID=27376 RepID=A0ACA9P1C9_9GLOM|nr:9462_t:CDS:2 [Acaulospora colombiana]